MKSAHLLLGPVELPPAGESAGVTPKARRNPAAVDSVDIKISGVSEGVPFSKLT